MESLSLNYLVELFLKVHQAVCVNVASVHANGQIATLQQLESVFLVLEEVLAFGDLHDAQLLETGLVLEALLDCHVNLITHLGRV